MFDYMPLNPGHRCGIVEISPFSPFFILKSRYSTVYWLDVRVTRSLSELEAGLKFGLIFFAEMWLGAASYISSKSLNIGQISHDWRVCLVLCLGRQFVIVASVAV